MHRTTGLLLITMLAIPARAQQPALTAHEADLQHRAEKLHPNQAISVVLNNTGEEYGNFITTGDGTFTFYDIDHQTRVTVPYSQIRTIKKGHGGFNSFQGRHTDRGHNILVASLVASAIATLLVLVVVADK